MTTSNDFYVGDEKLVTAEQLTRIGNRQVIASVSGGKDSVAMWLWARRNGLSPVAVYMDTKWEWDEPDKDGNTHYRHLELLESRIGKLHRTSASDGLDGLVKAKGTFPSRVHRWCTKELKLEPFHRWLGDYRDSTARDVLVVVGVRREESAQRADPQLTPEYEWSNEYDCEVWRPLLDWTVADVIVEHRRAAVPMHPLYHHGAERVGCFPCINAAKSELRIVGELAPKRIERIRQLEKETGQTMYRHKVGGKSMPVGIDEVLRWANTKHGGKELQLERPRTGCAKWGICEAQRDE